MFAVTRELKFGDLIVTVRELTVAEVRLWMNEPAVEKDDFDMFTDLLAFDGIGVEDLFRFTDLKREHLETLTPGSLSKIAAVIKEINGVFFNQYLPTLNSLRSKIDAAAVVPSNEG